MQAIRITVPAICLTLAIATETKAQDMGHDMQKEHGGQIFNMFQLEVDTGADRGDSVSRWDLDGWIGTDENKLWLKSEGEYAKSKMEEAEIWALYSRNIDTFWDAQIGLRYDFRPSPTAYLTVGVNGLAPYYFETEAHLFISDQGDLTARLRREGDILVTQKLVFQHYFEINLSAQDVPEQEIGAGVSDGKIGLQTRYEFTRKFAPYIDISYGRKFGETASFAEREGEDKDELIGAVGLKLMF